MCVPVLPHPNGYVQLEYSGLTVSLHDLRYAYHTTISNNLLLPVPSDVFQDALVFDSRIAMAHKVVPIP